MNTIRPSGVLAHSSRGLAEWLTGAGFLMIHATSFFVALVVLIPWNLYTDPGDFWAADPLIRWAFLLAFHALLVGVWSLIRNVIFKVDSSNDISTPVNRAWQSARAVSTPVNFRTSNQPGSAAANAASALWAEERARQWHIDSGEDIPPGRTPGSNGTGWGDQVTAAAPVEWPTPPAASAPPMQQDEEAETASHRETTAEKPRTSGPLGAAARATTETSDNNNLVDPELEWRWIEAAASAWLTRKERESYTGGQHPPPGHTGNDSASP